MLEADRWPNVSNLDFVEDLYARFLADPDEVPAEWRAYFESLDGSNGKGDGSGASDRGAGRGKGDRDADRTAAPEADRASGRGESGDTPGLAFGERARVGPDSAGIPPRPRVGPSFKPSSIFNPPGGAPTNGSNGHGNGNGNGNATVAVNGGILRAADVAADQDRVDQLVRSHRVRGHMIAQLDPLGLPRPHFQELDPDFYGFGKKDLERRFSNCKIHGPSTLKLREILERMRNTYCRSIGVQFMHIDDLRKKNWLQERMEGTQNRLQLSRGEQIRILTRLTDAVIFEEFLQKKFLGAKSFSLEGSESLIPLLDLAIERAGEQGVAEIVLGMAHRGRLNVLANILGKSPRDIFREFADADPELHKGRGDVKYHLGYSGEYTTSSGAIVHLSLCFNPSHLEFVNPVALGRVRAKQDRAGDRRHERGMALLIHGDAAFIGQGIVQETLNLSQLPGFATGGTIHVIVNNQIGFTTDPSDARSSVYCTDVAKMLQIPIFHVNGEDPEAVAQVVQLAMDFRHEFQSDVVIDMYGYRRRGHNEGDEPAFTQPLLYKAIRDRKPVREGYLDHLLQMNGVTREEADEIATERREHLEQELTVAQSKEYVHRNDSLGTLWHDFVGGPEKSAPNVETRVDRAKLSQLLARQTELPSDFHPHPKIQRWLELRREMSEGKKPLDWAAGEALAFASLLTQGTRIRMTGQDCERGTFSHRHTVLHDVENGKTFMPLRNLAPGQAAIDIFNSSLSEPGVLGFEYGYSLDFPDGLLLWEAQFGDFCNVAQVIIDQFIVSAEEKWRRLSGLVLLLPHGFEGQGPEHSSARLERFLAQAADDNIQVVNVTTPAQYFHCLRRQVVRPWRKPLIVMSPKSLLRHPRATSTLDDCANGKFQRILPDVLPAAPKGKKIERVLLCSGKLYYELEEEREKRGKDNVAILRIEELHPLTDKDLGNALQQYPAGTRVIWCQEEPENMGAWRYLSARMGRDLLGRWPLSCVSRPAAASPATGSGSSHKLEQQELLNQAFTAS